MGSSTRFVHNAEPSDRRIKLMEDMSVYLRDPQLAQARYSKQLYCRQTCEGKPACLEIDPCSNIVSKESSSCSLARLKNNPGCTRTKITTSGCPYTRQGPSNLLPIRHALCILPKFVQCCVSVPPCACIRIYPSCVDK